MAIQPARSRPRLRCCGVVLAKAQPFAIELAARSWRLKAGWQAGPAVAGAACASCRGLRRRELPCTRFRIIGLMRLTWWTWQFARATIIENAAGMSFLHLINLPFHEAGHILFIPLGRFMTVLGGSLFQVIVPASLDRHLPDEAPRRLRRGGHVVVGGRKLRRPRAVYRRCSRRCSWC